MSSNGEEYVPGVALVPPPPPTSPLFPPTPLLPPTGTTTTTTGTSTTVDPFDHGVLKNTKEAAGLVAAVAAAIGGVWALCAAVGKCLRARKKKAEKKKKHREESWVIDEMVERSLRGGEVISRRGRSTRDE